MVSLFFALKRWVFRVQIAQVGAIICFTTNKNSFFYFFLGFALESTFLALIYQSEQIITERNSSPALKIL